MKHIFKNSEVSLKVELLSRNIQFLRLVFAKKYILTCICVRLVVKHDLSLFCDYTTTSVILTCCLTETGVEDRSRHKETFHLADLFFRTRALIFTSLPRTSTFLVISSCKKSIHVNVYYITVPFIKKNKANEQLCKKNI